MHKRHRSRHIHGVGNNNSEPQRLTVELTSQERNEVLRALGPVVYAMRMPGRVIKIGCTSDLATRAQSLGAVEILAFRPGTYADEQSIHSHLVAHRHHGREWYHPTVEVMATVNQMREDLGLDPASA